MKAVELGKDEWLFADERVPDEELVFCLLWEFFRESQTVRDLAAEWGQWFAQGRTSSSEQQQRILWRRVFEAMPLINCPLQMDHFLVVTICQAFGAKGLIDHPWQKLPLEMRRRIAEECKANDPVFVGYDFPHLCELQIRTERDRAAERPVAEAKAVMRDLGKGKEIVLLVIDWARYDDNAVKKSIGQFAKQLRRPQGIVAEVRTGSGLCRFTEWRGKLNDLGLSRLSRYHAFQLQKSLPDAYETIASTLANNWVPSVEKKMAGARRRFKNSFKQLLPFEKHPPLCLAIPRFLRSQTR